MKVPLTKKCALQFEQSFIVYWCYAYSVLHVPPTAGGFDLMNYAFTNTNYLSKLGIMVTNVILFCAHLTRMKVGALHVRS